MRRKIATTLLITLPLLFGACSDSGGGGDDNESVASVENSDTGAIRLELSPETIKLDGLAFVDLSFDDATYDDINTQGLTLKLLIPAQFQLESNSTSLTLESGAVQVAPLYVGPAPTEEVRRILLASDSFSNEDLQVIGDFSFYVFALTPDILRTSDSGHLSLTYNVAGRPPFSAIFADIDRGAISSFSPENSDFDTEGLVTFTVVRVDVDD